MQINEADKGQENQITKKDKYLMFGPLIDQQHIHQNWSDKKKITAIKRRPIKMRFIGNTLVLKSQNIKIYI